MRGSATGSPAIHCLLPENHRARTFPRFVVDDSANSRGTQERHRMVATEPTVTDARLRTARTTLQCSSRDCSTFAYPECRSCSAGKPWRYKLLTTGEVE